MNTIIESKKLVAAMEVCETAIMFKSDYKAIDFIKAILPTHYDVSELNRRPNSFRCKSNKGIVLNPYISKHGVSVTDAEDVEHWDYIMQALKQHFKNEFLEVDHNVCHLHQDFVIYLRK